MDKLCDNCGARRRCHYRGIQNPCAEWSADSETRGLRVMAKKLIDKPMSFKEKQFVTGCVTLEVLSPKQIIWLRSLGLRFSMC